jgi:hypothetical protein
VFKGGQPPGKLPGPIAEFHIPLVQWKHGELAAAIERATKNR